MQEMDTTLATCGLEILLAKELVCGSASFFGNSSPKEAQDCRSELGEGFIASITRWSKSVEVLIPILYIKDISTGSFEEALVALLGKDAVGNATERLALSNVAVVGGWTP
jgi:hypothetical protein